jgi:hypothetical protein
MSITYRLKLFLGYNKNKLDIEIHKKNSEKIITNYLQKSTEKKMQIGVQGSSILGWLNVDILPKKKDTACMDATKTFPIADKNGVIRTTTLNIDLARLIAEPNKEEYQEYIRFYVEKFYSKNYSNILALQINKIFYAFYHIEYHYNILGEQNNLIETFVVEAQKV